MGKFNFESLKKTANAIIAKEVTPLDTPENSNYFYLTTLSENDVSFDSEYIKIITPHVEYKVRGLYTSRLDVEDKNREVTYNSTLAIDPSEGIMISKSQNHHKIPSEYLDKVECYMNRTVLTAASIKKRIIEDAQQKIKGKIRRTKDPIEDSDIEKIEILEHKIKKKTLVAVEWSQIKRISDGFVFATGYGYEGSSAQYNFLPDPTPRPVIPPVKKEEPAKNVEKNEKKVKKEKKHSKRMTSAQLSDMFSECFGQMIIASILAALILVVEFVVLLATNLFGAGAIFKAPAGVYTINTENYQNYIMIRQPYSNYYIEIEEGEKQTHVPKQTSNDMSNYSLFQIIPTNTSIALFDLNNKKSVRYYESYKPNIISRTIQKYEINDLYIRYEVTYSYNGVEETFENEMYFPDFGSLKNAYLTVDFPQDSMNSVTQNFVSNGKGDTYTQTRFWADVEYWSVRILEISGIAEVKEDLE